VSVSWIFKRWPSHTDDAGAVHDLSHVHPFQYTLNLEETPTRPARAIPIHVGFSSHTFTTRCDVADAHGVYSAPNDPRRFCPDRYGHSKRLPGIVKALKGRNCFFNQSRPNWLVVEIGGVPQGFEYWVFFHLLPANRKGQPASAAILLVESAFVGNVTRPPYGDKPKVIGFNALVLLALQGRKALHPVGTL
jgi:hypothetical protein